MYPFSSNDGRSVHFLACFPPRVKGEGLLLAILLTNTILLAVRPITAQDSAQHNSYAGVVRPCSITDVATKSSRGPSKSRKGPEEKTAAESKSCIEVHSTALDIQEYLQAYVRDLNWKIADEHVAEDFWTFFRILEKDELLNTTRSDASSTRVTWTSGRAFVRVGTVELKDGFTRVQISARFEGYGQSSDQFAPPKESWTLNSSGTLESQLLSALETHFKTLR